MREQGHAMILIVAETTQSGTVWPPSLKSRSSPEAMASAPGPRKSDEASLAAGTRLLWKPPSTSRGGPDALDGSDEAPEGEGLSLVACPNSLRPAWQLSLLDID